MDNDILPKPKLQKGFASMDREKQREIARKGGKRAHALGTAHKFNSKEGKLAGKKGGAARAKRLLEKKENAENS